MNIQKCETDIKKCLRMCEVKRENGGTARDPYTCT